MKLEKVKEEKIAQLSVTLNKEKEESFKKIEKEKKIVMQKLEKEIKTLTDLITNKILGMEKTLVSSH
jgi:F0F1-type ATP synthase membrane subunit b/b'